MDRQDRDEVVKWLRLGHDTFGPAGVVAVAKAMGIPLNPGTAGTGRPYGSATREAPGLWTATQGSDTLFNDEQPALPENRVRYQSIPRTKKAPLACPPTPPRSDPDWQPYVGYPGLFHCGFEGFIESRKPSPDWPGGECFYDEAGQLVGDSHPNAACKGTPNQFDAEDWFRHLLLDDGGVRKRGVPAFEESLWYSGDHRREWEEQYRRYHRRR